MPFDMLLYLFMPYSTFANGEVRAISFIAKYTAKGYGL